MTCPTGRYPSRLSSDVKPVTNAGPDALVRAKSGKIASASLVNAGKIFLIDSFVRNGEIDLSGTPSSPSVMRLS